MLETRDHGRSISPSVPQTLHEVKAVVKGVNIPEDTIERPLANLRKYVKKCVKEGKSHFQLKMQKRDPCCACNHN